MTEKDLLESNEDLMNKAGEILAGLPVYSLSAKIEKISRRKIAVTFTTQNISRLDLYLDGQPLRGSLDVNDGTQSLDIELPSRLKDALVLEIRGYEKGRLVAASRFDLKDAGIEP